MQILADDLYRTLESRADELGAWVKDLSGQLSARHGLRRALSLFEQYPQCLLRAASRDWAELDDPDERVQNLRFWLKHLTARSSLIEEFFSRSGDRSVSNNLVFAIEREAALLLPDKRHAVVAIGPADNYETFVADFRSYVFRDLEAPQDDDEKFGLFLVPRIESGDPLWRPVLLGHELAHLAIDPVKLAEDFRLTDRMNDKETDQLGRPPYVFPVQHPNSLNVLTAAEDWLEELVCDAFMLRRYGPAAIASLGTFLELVGAWDQVGDHPPGWFRNSLLLKWVGDRVPESQEAIVAPWRELAASPPPAVPDWAGYLMQMFFDSADDIMNLVDDWPDAYDAEQRAEVVEWLKEQLCAGVAPADWFDNDSETERDLDDRDLINAGWLARTTNTPMPVSSLVDKALESVDFLRRWNQALSSAAQDSVAKGAPESAGTVDENESSQDLPQGDPGDNGSDQEDETQGGDETLVQSALQGVGTLSEDAIRDRLRPTHENQLIVTPILPGSARGAAIDVRLGRRFIVFTKSNTGSFDPLQEDSDPRSMQESVERWWDQNFVLHPGELVLASTLEYFVMPQDLACQVITRSSYGRLGLLTATAILVHPHFRGCLTLELVNLGQLPIALRPGTRIAQLAFQVVSSPVTAPTGKDKYYCPTGPEFSKVNQDSEAGVLRNLGKT